ncbi:MAG: AAA family ATPase, partial [Alcaligenaceae bacterium]|nr:AAA family ATPase [Alcaligenaceae bacterium]
MQQDTQAEVLDFLKSASPHEAAEPARIVETHISVILLQGGRAWKLKRAVLLPYADFSTPALRLSACQREVELNRRTAPSIYIGARRITREDNGRLAFDGSGELVDAVVEMRRFDEDTLFSRLAAANRLNRPLLTALARDIAAFHKEAEIRPVEGAASIATILALNEQSTEIGQVLGQEAVQGLRTALRTALEHHRERLDARARAGKIRLCHGDLHLRNLCLVDGRPTLFDCIEFNETLATIDVLYDLAFLLMDLWKVGLPAEANWLMNRYLDESDENDGLPLLPFFMALRASIRAQVLATQAAMPDEPQRDALTAEAQTYLTLALELLQPGRAQLLAIGGLSGSGKSTLAAAIAHKVGPAPGARIWASDRIRKQQAGVPAETRLPPESYTLESSGRVYNALYEQTRHTLEEGCPVIADAVFSRPEERQAIEQCATQAGAAFLGVWLETDPAILMAR